MPPMPIISTEILVSCARTRQAGAAKTSAANMVRFIMRQNPNAPSVMQLTGETLFDRRVHSNYRRAGSRRPLTCCFDGKTILPLISSLRLVFVSGYVEPFQLAV